MTNTGVFAGLSIARKAVAALALLFALSLMTGQAYALDAQGDLIDVPNPTVSTQLTIQDTLTDVTTINPAEGNSDPVEEVQAGASFGANPMSGVSFASYMRKQIGKHTKHIELTQFMMTVNQFNKAYQRFRHDNRQVTCLYYRYTYWYNAAGYIVALDPIYKVSKSTCKKEHKKLKAGIKRYLKVAKKQKTKYAKAKAVHDYMAKKCQYDVSAYSKRNYMSHAYDAVGVFAKNKAVCQGYAEAYQIVMEKLGIPCVVVSNKAIDHAWNYVKLGGKWRNVDVTWDDPIPDRGPYAYPLYTYWFKTDSEFLNVGHANYLTVDVTSRTSGVKLFRRWA